MIFLVKKWKCKDYFEISNPGPGQSFEDIAISFWGLLDICLGRTSVKFRKMASKIRAYAIVTETLYLPPCIVFFRKGSYGNHC